MLTEILLSRLAQDTSGLITFKNYNHQSKVTIMAIQLEFIDFIVPISIIEKKYPGGWNQCLNDHKNLVGGRVWYDEYLFRDGAMNPMDVESLVNEWQMLGFNTHSENEDGRPIEWVDVCVCEGMLGGPTLKCNWLEVNTSTQTACLKGSGHSEPVGRLHFESEK